MMTVYITKKPSRHPELRRDVAALTDHAVVRVTADGATPYLRDWVTFAEMQECYFASAPPWGADKPYPWFSGAGQYYRRRSNV